MPDQEKTMLQVDIKLYKTLRGMRRLREDSKFRSEPLRNVVQRILDFYLENGGKELEAEYRDSISQ